MIDTIYSLAQVVEGICVVCNCGYVVDFNCFYCRIALQLVATRNAGELFSGMSKRQSGSNIARVWKQTKQIVLGAIAFLF